MTISEVVAALGAPSKLGTRSDGGVPLYWCYGKLEIQFDTDAPYKVNWFQIEWAGDLEGDFEIFTSNLVLALGGLTGRTTPLGFLSADIWHPSDVAAYFVEVAGDITVNLLVGKVQLVFRVDQTFLSDKDPKIYLAKNAMADIIRDIDPHCELDSIYSHSSELEAETSSRRARRQTSGVSYKNAFVGPES
ncbi:hypothetical protein [Rhizobium rhizogenes]|uniref:hypothetical protein n=1 Tax=Rhizobium rhizogenes TaxID=359 RepID=UPI0015727CEC|nr:hypothetical protein [Rhizobium rhizogenes]NTF43180.1 hypothetical protein [Rhizobium rhizogenes]